MTIGTGADLTAIQCRFILTTTSTTVTYSGSTSECKIITIAEPDDIETKILSMNIEISNEKYQS